MPANGSDNNPALCSQDSSEAGDRHLDVMDEKLAVVRNRRSVHRPSESDAQLGQKRQRRTLAVRPGTDQAPGPVILLRPPEADRSAVLAPMALTASGAEERAKVSKPARSMRTDAPLPLDLTGLPHLKHIWSGQSKDSWPNLAQRVHGRILASFGQS